MGLKIYLEKIKIFLSLKESKEKAVKLRHLKYKVWFVASGTNMGIQCDKKTR